VIPIELDKPRRLHFGVKDIEDLEAALDRKPLLTIMHDVGNLGVTAMVTTLWAGLKHEDPHLTINLTRKIFQSYLKEKKSMRVLGKALRDALVETGLLNTDEDESGNEQTAAALQ
jgi:hypothetical protein